MIINAENLILGRLASFAAKKALMGEAVEIVNCEKAVVTGKKVSVFNKYKERRKKGDAMKGPFLHRIPNKIVKRTIRGMLPYKQEKGRKAFKKIKCYMGIPNKLKQSKLETIKEANIIKTQNLNYVTIEKIAKFLGK